MLSQNSGPPENRVPLQNELNLRNEAIPAATTPSGSGVAGVSYEAILRQVKVMESSGKTFRSCQKLLVWFFKGDEFEPLRRRYSEIRGTESRMQRLIGSCGMQSAFGICSESQNFLQHNLTALSEALATLQDAELIKIKRFFYCRNDGPGNGIPFAVEWWWCKITDRGEKLLSTSRNARNDGLPQ